jgi:hypothetical protein
MTIYYIDFEGGNDANAGTSFATRWQTITNGATTGRIAPGDEIRIMASPDPTSIGSATWTGGGRPNSVAISSSTNASPIVITTATAHGLVAGDYVVIPSHATNTNALGVWKVGTVASATQFEILQLDGANTTGNGAGTGGTIVKANNLVVKTASPLVQNIALCGGLGQKPAWTDSASVTTTTSTSTLNKEGAFASQIAIAAGFTTGKAAYYTLPSTLDLSAYEQVSFWVRQSAGTVNIAGRVYVALCTDTIGNTVAHQCDVPDLGALNVWVPVTVNLGTALNSAIQSVAFYVVSDQGAQTFQLDNIIACKAASAAHGITLQSLISKSDGSGDEAWYPIQSINYDVIMLGNENSRSSLATEVRGYNGTSETLTTYKRETLKTAPTLTPTAVISLINDNGTDGNPIVYSGGWNRTDMSTQTGRTWLDGQNGFGRGFGTNQSRSFLSIDHIDLCRYNDGLYFANPASYVTVSSVYVTGNTIGFNPTGLSNSTITSIWANNNGTGINFTGYGCVIADVKDASNNSTDGLFLSAARFVTVGSLIAGNCGTLTNRGNLRFSTSMNCVVKTATLTNAAQSLGVTASASFNCFVNGGSSSGNSIGVRLSVATNPAEIYLNNFTINEATEVDISECAGFVYSNRHDETDNNSWIWQNNTGTVNQQTTIVDSPATTAWQMRPTSTFATATMPVMLKLGTVVCAANALVTVTARMRRDDTGLTMRLVCPGGQITGVTNDVSSDMTAAADTWETVTITFTPTKAGAVDVYAYAFGGTTFSGFVCNLTANQA